MRRGSLLNQILFPATTNDKVRNTNTRNLENINEDRRHSFPFSSSPFLNVVPNVQKRKISMKSREQPRFGLPTNDNDHVYCIYAFNAPECLPRGYIEHKVPAKAPSNGIKRMKSGEVERTEIQPPAYSDKVGFSGGHSWEEFRRENANPSGYANRNSVNLDFNERIPTQTYSNRNSTEMDSNSAIQTPNIRNTTNLNWRSSRFGQSDFRQFSPTFERLSPRSKRLFQDNEFRFPPPSNYQHYSKTNKYDPALSREDPKKNQSTINLSSPTGRLDSRLNQSELNLTPDGWATQKDMPTSLTIHNGEIKPKTKPRMSNQPKKDSPASDINESFKLDIGNSSDDVHHWSSSMIVGEDDLPSEDEGVETYKLTNNLGVYDNTNNLCSAKRTKNQSSESSTEEHMLKDCDTQKQTSNLGSNSPQQYFQDIESVDELQSQKSDDSRENTYDLSIASERSARPPVIYSKNYESKETREKPQALSTNGIQNQFQNEPPRPNANELEALKKKSRVSSMCKNFENIFGRKPNDQVAIKELSSLDIRKSSTTSTTISDKSNVESSQKPKLSHSSENDKNSDYHANEVKLIPSRTSSVVQQDANIDSSKSSTTNETDYRHQIVVDNIIAASLTPIQSARNSESPPRTIYKHENIEEDYNPASLCAVPDLDDRVQTVYKVLHRLPELDEIFILSEVFGQNRRSTKSDCKSNDQSKRRSSELHSSILTKTKSDEMSSDASKKPFQVLKRTLRPFRSHSTAEAPAPPFVNNNRYAAPPNPPPPVPNHHATHFSQNHRSGSAVYTKNHQPPTISAPLIMDTVSEQKMIKVFASMENNFDENNSKSSHEPLKNIGNHQNGGGGIHLQRSLTSSSTSSTIRPEDSISMKTTKFTAEPANSASNGSATPTLPPAKPPLNMANMTSGNDTKGINKPGSNSDNSVQAKGKDDLPELKLTGFVGFDSLPYQLVRKCHANGFQFNLLCVGETGMGKTTLIESLFNMKMDFAPCNNELKTVELRTKTCEVCESGVRVKLRVVETAGFGDQLDKDKSAQVIVDYINEQFESYLKEELKIRRCLAYYDDTRIHACLYFISPTGHGLKALDVVTMRELSKRVNVIPVIAKSDTACKDELIRFKQKIMNELKANKIEIYQFPTDDEAVRNENAALNALLPFAVVGSCDFVTKEDGRLVRARNYVWGRVEVENEEHCDFVKLREALLRINEDSLREKTHAVLYENYRRQRLQEMKMVDGDAGPRMMEATLSRKKEFEADIRRRDEQFNKEFTLRVQRKEADLKHREEGLNVREAEIRERFKNEMTLLDIEKSKLDDDKQRILNNSGNGKKQRK